MSGERGPLRVGIAGAGWEVGYHVAAWRAASQRAQVVAIADPSHARVRERCEALRIPSGYETAEAMLAVEDIDVLDICAPREAHAPLVRLGIAHGVAVLCQK